VWCALAERTNQLTHHTPRDSNILKELLNMFSCVPPDPYM